jgi:amphi-Trp domain-containing protein
MKRRKIRHADQRNVQACIDQLQALVDGLKAGSIELEQDGQAVLLSPGGVVQFDFRVDQAERKETLRVEMSWQPEAGARQPGESVVPRPDARAVNGASKPPLESDVPARSNGAPQGELEGPLVTPSRDRLAAAESAQLYASARVVGSDGQWHIDQDRLIESLAEAGVDALTQQELYSAALQADADGRTSVLSERVIEALEQVTRRESPSEPRG